MQYLLDTAKLVVLMGIYGIAHTVTLNPVDFARYLGIAAMTPEQVLTSGRVTPM